MKNRIIALVVGIILLLFCALLAQAPDTLWTRSYGEGVARYVEQIIESGHDSGYFIAGSTHRYTDCDFYLIRTDPNGDTLWTSSYGGGFFIEAICRAAQHTSDSGFITVGYIVSTRQDVGTRGVYLVKFNSNGFPVWDKFYGGNGDDVGNSIRQTSDGGFIIAGSTTSYGSGYAELYLIKTDENGDSLWIRTYDGGFGDYNGYCVQLTSDGGYIVAGWTNAYHPGSKDVYILKTDSLGDTLWARAFGGPAHDDIAYSILETSKGNYVFTGRSGSSLLLKKIDKSGEAIWTKLYAAPQGISVKQTSDSGFIIACEGYSGYFLIKTNSEGDTIWTKNYAGGSSKDVTQTHDGGYVIVGGYNQDVYLVRLHEDVPPVIDSTTIWSDTSYAGPFPIYSKITDITGVDTVLLYFKRKEDPTWFSTRMLMGGNNWYYKEIPQVFLPNDTVKYYIYAKDVYGNEASSPVGAPYQYFSFVANLTSIEETNSNPKNLNLIANPISRREIVFKMNIPKQSSVSLNIYDLSGRLNANPITGVYNSGSYEIRFKLKHSGIYFYILKTDFEIKKGKIILF